LRFLWLGAIWLPGNYEILWQHSERINCGREGGERSKEIEGS
jgi:hypothetical protein